MTMRRPRVGCLPVVTPGTADADAVDRVLECCFQLLSLAFMASGSGNKFPGAFALLSNVERLLTHLTEVSFYSRKDLESLQQAVTKLDEHYQSFQETSCAARLLAARIKRCHETLAELSKRLDKMHGDLPETHERLVCLLRKVADENTRSRVCHVNTKAGIRRELTRHDSVLHRSSGGWGKNSRLSKI